MRGQLSSEPSAHFSLPLHSCKRFIRTDLPLFRFPAVNGVGLGGEVDAEPDDLLAGG